MKVAILNGALGGADGNTALLLGKLVRILGKTNVEHTLVALVGRKRFSTELLDLLTNSDAWFVATGTYWDSWGSPLQLFLEWLTPLEGYGIVGKPVGIIVTGHSVGAKGILSRLQGVLSTFGMLIPPMSGMVVTMASQEARRAVGDSWMEGEFWGSEDLEIIAHNVLEATKIKGTWRTWHTGGAEACEKRWLDPGV